MFWDHAGKPVSLAEQKMEPTARNLAIFE